MKNSEKEQTVMSKTDNGQSHVCVRSSTRSISHLWSDFQSNMNILLLFMLTCHKRTSISRTENKIWKLRHRGRSAVNSNLDFSLLWKALEKLHYFMCGHINAYIHFIHWKKNMFNLYFCLVFIIRYLQYLKILKITNTTTDAKHKILELHLQYNCILT